MAPPSEHKHVLIVDDESSTRLIVERILRSGIPGIRVSCVGDGAQALALLDREQVDLLITDLGMPVIDGIELLLQIARRRLLIPVLVMSAHGSLSEARALAGGAIEFFSKPIRAAPLLESVKQLLATELASATMEVISLAGLVRIIGMERKTCALRVTAPKGQGVLVFVDGELVDARQDTLRGLPAALATLALNDPYVTLELTVRSRARTIDVALKEVLRKAYLAASVPRSLASTPPAGAASELEQPPDFRGAGPPKRARNERPAAAIVAQNKPIVPAARPASTARRPEPRPPTVSAPGPVASPPAAVSSPPVAPSSPPAAVSSPPVAPPTPVVSLPPTLLRSPPLASRTVPPPPVPAPPRVTAPPRAPLLSSPTTLRQRAGTLLGQVGAAQANPAASSASPPLAARAPDPPPGRPAPATPATHDPPADEPAGRATLATPTPPDATAEISTHQPAEISTHQPTELSTHPPPGPTLALPEAAGEISAHPPPGPTLAPPEAAGELSAHPPPGPTLALPEAAGEISAHPPPEPAEPASTGPAEAPIEDPPAPIDAAPQEPPREIRDPPTATAQAPADAETSDPREQAAPAPAEPPAASDAPTPAPPTPAPSPGVTAKIEGLDSTDYFELMDRAHDLMRVAEFEIADLLLQRALQLRPGDRVVQQNLRVLAKRRGSSQAMNP